MRRGHTQTLRDKETNTDKEEEDRGEGGEGDTEKRAQESGLGEEP